MKRGHRPNPKLRPRRPDRPGPARGKARSKAWQMGLVALACVAAVALVVARTPRFRSRTSSAEPKPNAAALTPTQSLGPATGAVAAAAVSNAQLAAASSLPEALPEPATLNDPVELVNLGTALVGQRRISNAIAYYQRALELAPDDEEIYFNLGFAYTRLGQFDQALRYYTKCLELFPDYAEAHHNLGNVYLAKKQFDQAMAHYSTSLKLQPDNPSTLNDVGRCLALQNKFQEAIAYFAEAARLDTNLFEARFNLANAFLVSGRYTEAVSTFEELVRDYPGFLAARAGLEKARRLQASGGKAR